jgi:hypothetical protein
MQLATPPSFSTISETITSPEVFSMPSSLLEDYPYPDLSDFGDFLPQASSCAGRMMDCISLVDEDARGATTPNPNHHHQSPPVSISPTLQPLTTSSRSASLSFPPTPAPESSPSRRGSCPNPERGWLGPLHLAASKGNDRIVRILLQHQSPGCGVNDPDSDGQTALMHAVQGGFEDVVRSLLGAGAGVDDTDGRKRTALHWAVLTRRPTMLRQLLEHGVAAGVDLDVYDIEGKTPLHRAIAEGFEAGVEVLLEFGVDTKCKAQKT